MTLSLSWQAMTKITPKRYPNCWDLFSLRIMIWCKARAIWVRLAPAGKCLFTENLPPGFTLWYFRFLQRPSVTDTTNGFRAIRLSIFNDERINLKQEWLDTYELEPYILWKVITLGYKFKEVFVTKIYPPKKMGGYTKMIPFVSWWSILKPLFYLRLGIKK